MVDPDQILLEWKKDCAIDEVLLDESSLKIPCLHSKYLDYLNQLKVQMRKLQNLKKSIPASDRRGNERYESICSQIDSHTDAIEHTEKIIYHINGMTYNIKNIIAWRQFTSGANS